MKLGPECMLQLWVPVKKNYQAVILVENDDENDFVDISDSELYDIALGTELDLYMVYSGKISGCPYTLTYYEN